MTFANNDNEKRKKINLITCTYTRRRQTGCLVWW